MLKQLEDALRYENQSFPPKWSLFIARFRLVLEFTGINFHNLQGKTAQGYEAAIRVGLVYSALEALWNAIGVSKSTPIRDKQAAKVIRQLRGSKFEAYLINSARRDSLQTSVERMFSSQDIMDLTPLMEVIRHSVFHGAFTPHGSGYTNSSNVRLLLDLVCELAIDTIQARVALEVRYDSLD